MVAPPARPLASSIRHDFASRYRRPRTRTGERRHLGGTSMEILSDRHRPSALRLWPSLRPSRRDGDGAGLPDQAGAHHQRLWSRDRRAMCSSVCVVPRSSASRRASNSSSSTSPVPAATSPPNSSSARPPTAIRCSSAHPPTPSTPRSRPIFRSISPRISRPSRPLGSVPNLLVVNPSLGVTNVRELIALAKAKPDQISYATSGVGTLSHMAGELLNVLAGHQARARPLPERRASDDRRPGRPGHGRFSGR